MFVRRGFPLDPSPLPRSCQRESGVSDEDTRRRIWQPTINTRTRVVALLGDPFLGAKCSTAKATDAREPGSIVPHALVSRGRACIADHLSEMRARPSVAPEADARARSPGSGSGGARSSEEAPERDGRISGLTSEIWIGKSGGERGGQQQSTHVSGESRHGRRRGLAPRRTTTESVAGQ